MSAFKIILESGYRYYAGMSLPWYVSRGMVTTKLKEQGFVEITWHERGATPLPTNVKPRAICKGYDDDWDLWCMATYVGPSGDGELPAKPAWIMYAMRAVPIKPGEEADDHTDATPNKPTTPGNSDAGSKILTILGIVAGILTIRKLVK
jgi:hypothetical protein